MSLSWVVVLVVVVALSIAWQIGRRLRRAREVRAFGAEHGLIFDLRDPHNLLRATWSIFPEEERRRVGNTLAGTWGGHAVLAGDVTTGTRTNDRSRILSVVQVPLPIAAPGHVSVVPHDAWSRLRKRLGFDDVAFPSDDFNRRYHVRTDAKEFALSLLDLALIAWLLNLDRRFGFDVLEGRVLFTSTALRGDELGRFFDAATGFVDRIPRRVLEDYAP